MVCPNDWEARHPQDFLRAVPDHQAVPWARPETPDVFTGPACPYPTFFGMADVGTADCARAGLETPVLVCTTNSSTAGIAIAGCSTAGA